MSPDCCKGRERQLGASPSALDGPTTRAPWRASDKASSEVQSLSTRLQSRDNQPSGSASRVDQLLGRETCARTQVSEVALRGTRPDAHELGGVMDGSASRNEGRQYIHLALRRLRRERAAQVPGCWLSSHSLGMFLDLLAIGSRGVEATSHTSP